MTEPKIDPQLFDLYDEYCHSSMQRRDFLSRASALGIAGGVAGCAGGEIMLPNYARSQQVSFTDQRIKASYASYDSPGGNAAIMRGYLVQRRGEGPFPSVLVVHENRGLNPYVKDVARRAAVAGFLAFAPDAFASHIYPGTRHGFHNGSTPRYAPEAAELAWNRTIDLFKRTLA